MGRQLVEFDPRMSGDLQSFILSATPRSGQNIQEMDYPRTVEISWKDSELDSNSKKDLVTGVFRGVDKWGRKEELRMTLFDLPPIFKGV